MMRPLVTLHLPLEMGLVARIMREVARAYPGAVVGENGQILGDDGLGQLAPSVGCSFDGCHLPEGHTSMHEVER